MLRSIFCILLLLFGIAEASAGIVPRIDVPLVDGCFLTAINNGSSTAEQRFPLSIASGASIYGLEYRLLDYVNNRIVQDWKIADVRQLSDSRVVLCLSASIGSYRILLRNSLAGASFSIQEFNWIVAPVLLLIGQSPMKYFHSSFPSKGSELESNLYICSASRPGLLSGRGASVARGLKALSAAFGTGNNERMSIVVICAAVGGTSSTNWADKKAIVWQPMLKAVDSLGRPDHVFVIWLNGASDSSYSRERIFSNHDAIYSHLKRDLLEERGISFCYSVIPHNRDTGGYPLFMQKVRESQMQWVSQHPEFGKKVFIAAQWFDMQTNVEYLGTVARANERSLCAVKPDFDAPIGSYRKCELFVVSGKAAGQRAEVLSFDPRSSVFAISSPWGIAPESGDKFLVTGRSPHPSHSYMGVGRLGDRLAAWLAGMVGRGQIVQYPEIEYVEWDGFDVPNQLSVKVRHFAGRHLRTLSGSTSVQGFEVSFDEGRVWQVLDGVEISGSDRVRIRLPNRVGRPDRLRLRYLHGTPIAGVAANQLMNILYDDSGVGVDTGLPVLFSLGNLKPRSP